MRKSMKKHFASRTWQLLFAIALLVMMIIGLGQGSVTANQFDEAELDGVSRLIKDTNGAVKISTNKATGAASFVRMPAGEALPSGSSRTASALTSANAFFTQYGDAFGVSKPESELVLVDNNAKQYVGAQLTFQQVHQDVPVFAAILKVRHTERNQVTSVNGTFVPKISIKSTTPDLSAADAEQIAVKTVAAQVAPATRLSLEAAATLDLSAASSELYIYRTGLVEGVPGKDHLVYEVEVINSSVSIREFVYVDAHTGELVDQTTGIFHGLNREVSETSLANVVWVEGDPEPIPPAWNGGTAQQVTDWNNEIDGAEETYNLFASMANWDSYDNAGATMRTVNNDPGISCPNANWNGISTNYCTDVTGDDTVAHEWGHAYTDNTNNLIYAWQSGALNESYSDIWGDTVDLINGRGIDAPDVVRASNTCSSNVAGANFPGNPTVDTVRWLSGEDDPAFFGSPGGSGNAIRDMWDPTCFGDPGKVTDTEYFCSTADGGGVHTNSGVPNHAYALMVDGGTYNGQTVSAIGLTKAAHIHWGAQTMLTPASNFVDHADALEASCSALVGVNLPALSTSAASAGPSGEIIDAADCQEVTDAIAAVEFRTEPTQCNFSPLLDPDAPALCEGAGVVEPIASEDWEGGSLPAGWTVGTREVANPGSFDTPDWAVVDSLPVGANGTYAAFVEDGLYGSCTAEDTEAGVLFLDSPPIEIPATAAFARVAVDHWVATEVGWDGGNFKVSVNGGPWTMVPPSSFDFNAYNSSINGGGNDNPLAGEPGFTGTDGGSVGGSWGQSQVSLLGLAFPGDTVQFRVEMGLDGCNGVIGWFVDDVQVYSCSEDQGPICGNSILEVGESCDDGNSASGDGCSNVCQIESGWSCEDPTSPTAGANVIDDGSFEAGAFGGTWNESSLSFGTPLCDIASCGTGTGTGPSEGNWWTWFGGIAAYEAGSVSQDVAVPATATDMTFDLEQIICDSGADYMSVEVDGNQEFLADGSSSLCGTLGYATQTIDMSAYADGGNHEISFTSETFANNGGGSNFFVDNVVLSDNVEIPGSPSVCTPIVADIACNAGLVGFDEGIPGSWTVVDNAGFGLVWSNIAGAGESGNYTGGDGDAATVSSDAFGPADFDTELRSNLFNIPNGDTISLDYLANYQNFAAFDFLELDISTDGGSSWATLLSWNEDHGGFRGAPGEAVSIDLLPYAGMNNVQLRWRYYDPTTFDWDWYAQVDEITLSCERTVGVDIKPGNNRNPINLKSKGVIPVAILSTADFDASTVDPLSVAFGPNGAGESHGKGHRADVNKDNRLDLVLHFKTQESGIACGDTSASLTGMTYDGLMISGSDSIHIVKCK